MQGALSASMVIPLMLRLRSPDFEPAEQQIEAELSGEITTPLLTFLVTAKKAGTQLLNVDLFANRRLAGARILRTEAQETDMPPGGAGAVAPPPPPPPDWTLVASLAMTIATYIEEQRLRYA